MFALKIKRFFLALLVLGSLGMAGSAEAQGEPILLDSDCTVSVGNQTVFVREEGGFLVRNIAIFQSRDTGIAPQLYRVRATCLRDGEMVTGQSAFFPLTPSSTTFVAEVFPSELDPIPVGLEVTAGVDFLPLGNTVQLNVSALLPDGGTEDVTPRSAGTTYLSTNTNLLTVTEDGQVTGANATSRPQTGTIAVLNEGNITTISFTAVGSSNDFDNDGMPNDYEELFGLNPFSDDGAGDLDGDGLSNREEFELGTLPNQADTDLDGIPDGLDGDPLRPEFEPPRVEILLPQLGSNLLQGQTLNFTVDASDDGLLTGVEFLVNGVSFAQLAEPPFEFPFTIPYATETLTFGASAMDAAGNRSTATDVLASVGPDPLTWVEGSVLDFEGSPVAGAEVELEIHGLVAEFFDFDTPLSSLPDLGSLAPDAVRQISSVNFLNPDNLLSLDTFGTGFEPDFAARISGFIRIPTAGSYEFTLGGDDGARLWIDGIEVVAMNGPGEFTENTGAIDLPSGLLPIVIEYFQAVEDSELQLLSRGPADLTASVVAAEALHPGTEPPTTLSAADGSFALDDIPAGLGELEGLARAVIDGAERRGTSGLVSPVAGGVTDLGAIQIGASTGLLFVAGSTPDELAEVFDTAQAPALPADEDFVPADTGVIFSGDFLQIGVNAQGSLMFGGSGLSFDPLGSGAAFGFDALWRGTLRDVWSVQFNEPGGPDSLVYGGALGGPNDGNVGFERFEIYQDGDLEVARSVMSFGDLEIVSVTSLPRASQAVYIDVTLINRGTTTLENVLFLRSSDFDVNNTTSNAFDVSETPGGGTLISAGNSGADFVALATGEAFSIADGINFADRNPAAFGNNDPDGDVGDYSATFVFSLGALAPGQSVSLSDATGATLAIGAPSGLRIRNLSPQVD